MNAGRQLARAIAIAKEAKRRADRDVRVCRLNLDLATRALARAEKRARDADVELDQLMVRVANLKGTRRLTDTYSFDDARRAGRYSQRWATLFGAYCRSYHHDPRSGWNEIPPTELIPAAAHCAALISRIDL